MPHRRPAAAMLGATVATVAVAALPHTSGFGAGPSLTFAPAARLPLQFPAALLPRRCGLAASRSAALRCSLNAEREAVAVGTAGVMKNLSPSQARVELERLADSDRWEKDEVVRVLSSIQGAGGKPALFNSSAILFRKTAKGEVQMLTRGVIKPGTIDLNGDDDMEVLNQAFYATLFSSMVRTLSASILLTLPTH